MLKNAVSTGVLLVMWVIFGQGGNPVGADETTSAVQEIPAEDLEIIRSMELLDSLDLLSEDFDLYENYDDIHQSEQGVDDELR